MACQLPQPDAQLVTVTPQTTTAWPHGMLAQSGSVQATHWLAVQLSPVGHVPQETVPLQPLETFPQVKLPQACAGVFGAQHVLAVHVSPMAQVPGHAMVPPQPSDTEPH